MIRQFCFNIIPIAFLILYPFNHSFSQEERLFNTYPASIQNKLALQLLVHADSGNLNKVEMLLEVGVDPNSSTWDGVTPLMYAAQNGHYKVARELIAYGANLNAENMDKYTALHYSTISNQDSIAELLILNGANVHPVNIQGVSPLHFASTYGYPFMTDILLYYGAFIDSTDSFGNTPLLSASYSGSLLVSEILLDKWADVDKADNKGFTPLMVAAQFNDTTLIKLLTDYGADINLKNKDGINALALAINSRAEDAANLLISKGAANSKLDYQVSYSQLAHRNGLQSVSYSLSKSSDEKYTLKPSLNRLTIIWGTTFNANDFYFTGGAKANITDLRLSFGFEAATRPLYKHVLVEEDYESYQFFEGRSYLALSSTYKIYNWFNRKGKQSSINIGLKGTRSWGKYSYEDAETKPKSYNILSPVVEFEYNSKELSLHTQAFVWNMDHLRKHTLTFTLTMGFNINFDKPKIKSKKLEWY